MIFFSQHQAAAAIPFRWPKTERGENPIPQRQLPSPLARLRLPLYKKNPFSPREPPQTIFFLSHSADLSFLKKKEEQAASPLEKERTQRRLPSFDFPAPFGLPSFPVEPAGPSPSQNPEERQPPALLAKLQPPPSLEKENLEKPLLWGGF